MSLTRGFLRLVLSGLGVHAGIYLERRLVGEYNRNSRLRE